MVKASKVQVQEISINNAETSMGQLEESRDDSHSYTLVQNIHEIPTIKTAKSGSQLFKRFSFLKKLQRRPRSIREHPVDTRAERIKPSRLYICLERVFDFHFKNWANTYKILILFHLLSIIGLFACGLIDTLMYSTNSKDKSVTLQFIHGLRYIPMEILTIIYGSGVAAFGISIEIYPLIIQAIVNCTLLVRTCGGSDEALNAITWVIKMIIFFPAVELSHRNFRKLQNYNEHFNSSARSMLRQALFIGTAMLGRNLQGLRALYRATYINLPRSCIYETSNCAIVNMYQPLFSYDDDMCLDDLSDYIAGREQIRLLRDFSLINIAVYSVFNKHFLKINADAKYLWIRVPLIILFVALSTSIPISYINPLFFTKSNCRLVYFIIEGIIFAIILGLMTFNLYRLRHNNENASPEVGEMDKSPPLLS